MRHVRLALLFVAGEPRRSRGKPPESGEIRVLRPNVKVLEDSRTIKDREDACSYEKFLCRHISKTKLPDVQRRKAGSAFL